VFAGWCAGRGVPAIPAAPAAVAAFLASEADRGFRPVTIGRRAAAIARRAPSAGPFEPVRHRRGPAGPLGDPPPTQHRTRAEGRAASTSHRSSGSSPSSTPHPGWAARPGAAAARVRCRAAPLGARRPRRRAPRVHDRPRAAGDDRLIQDRPRAGRSDGGGPVRARETTGARSGYSGRGSRPESTAAPRSGGCATATPSAPSGSPASRSR
jgi:hypothetical protein